MKKITWLIRSALHEIFEEWKLKSTYLFIVNKKFRKDMNKLADLVCNGTSVQGYKHIRLNEIIPSYDAIYQKVVSGMIHRISYGEGLSVIKVIKVKNKYVVVNGMHRYTAINRMYGEYHQVFVKELIKDDNGESVRW